MQVTGEITQIMPVQTGTKKDGGTWQKQIFILKTDEAYNNLYCFDVFGDEKVANLTKYNKVGDTVNVEFNIQTNDYQGKYFTSLQAWKISKIGKEEPSATVLPETADGLPF